MLIFGGIGKTGGCGTNDNAIMVAASGSILGDVQHVWRAKSVGGYHVEYNFSCMSYEVNAALGAKLVEPNR